MTEITQEELKQLIHYDPNTGIFTWKPRQDKRWDARFANKTAGTRHRDGYIAIKIREKVWLAHRLAWFYMTGAWPESFIGHINDDKTDNRWENLKR